MLTVNKCLCFKLETGACIIGWFALIGNMLLAVFSLVGVIFLSINNCSDMAKLGKEFSINIEKCPTLRGVIIGAFIFVIIGSMTIAFVGWKCIQGTKTRDPSRIRPLMILLAITTTFSTISMFSLTFSGFFNGAINATINGYSFIVLHSLYNIFDIECENWVGTLELQAKEEEDKV